MKGLVQNQCRPPAPVLRILKTFALSFEGHLSYQGKWVMFYMSDKVQTEVTGTVVHFHKRRSNLCNPYVQLGDEIL